MQVLVFYVPRDHCESVKSALFAAGAGKLGNYGECCWQVCGEGQFRPLRGSHPALGQQGELERVAEYRVEMLVADQLLERVLHALRSTHPYETPAYHYYAASGTPQ